MSLNPLYRWVTRSASLVRWSPPPPVQDSWGFFDALRRALFERLVESRCVPAVDGQEHLEEISLVEFLSPANWLPVLMLQALRADDAKDDPRLDVDHLGWFAVGTSDQLRAMGVTLLEDAQPDAVAWAERIFHRLSPLPVASLLDPNWEHSGYATGPLLMVNVGELLGSEVYEGFGMTDRVHQHHEVWGRPWQNHVAAPDGKSLAVRLHMASPTEAIFAACNFNRARLAHMPAGSAAHH